MPFEGLMEGINAELKANFEHKVDGITHSQEKGEARESALREILSTYLPNRCGVSTGFVIDKYGHESKQIDVVIYDKQHTPVFKLANSKQYFPCETVLAVGEVKSEINSRELEDSLEKIASVKTLNRSGAPVITGPGRNLTGQELSRHDHRDQIYGFVFTSESMNKDTFLKTYYQKISELQNRLWPNFYCDYNNFDVSYVTVENVADNPDEDFDGEYLYSYDPNNADGLYLQDEEQKLFILFFTLLSAFINEAHVGRPRLLDYYGLEPYDADVRHFPVD